MGIFDAVWEAFVELSSSVGLGGPAGAVYEDLDGRLVEMGEATAEEGEDD